MSNVRDYVAEISSDEDSDGEGVIEKAANAKRKLDQKISSVDPDKMRKVIKVADSLCALFLLAGALVAFFDSPNFLTVCMAFVVLFFACLLVAFSFRKSSWDSYFYNNFGFFYSWKGRLVFLVFVGMLSLGLGDIGLYAAIFTFVMIFVSWYGISHHPDLLSTEKQSVKQTRTRMAAKNVKKHAKRRAKDHGGEEEEAGSGPAYNV